MEKPILNTIEAAKYLGVSKQFLERDRHIGAKIPFIKMGTRAVRYRLSDLQDYISANLRKAV